MTEDVLVGMLSCDGCSHVIGYHDGKGCNVPGCTCAETKEDVLEGNIDVATREYRAQFGLQIT